MINQEHLQNISILNSQYKNADPFPYVVIDNFLNDHLANMILGEVKKYQHWNYDEEEHTIKGQRNKYYAPSPLTPLLESSINNLKLHTPLTWFTLNYLKSKKVLNFLENITEIYDLKNDNDWLGGGLHKTINNGKLAIHADFNVHWKLNLHRRLNMLIYLNKDWKSEYNGNLELWDKNCQHCVRQIEPIFNRAVIFRITDDAFHGHPIPLNVPEEVARYSIAMYYYTDDRPESEKSEPHAVEWKNT